MKCAVNDIRITIGFPRHWKTKRLRRRIGDDAIRMLLCLWESAAQSYQDGNLYGLDSAAIADASDYEGDPDEWIAALTDALPGHSGWLDGEPGAYRLHDWAEHQPWIVEAPARSEQAKKAATARYSKPEASKENARGMPAACSVHADSMPTALPLSFPLLPSPIERESSPARTREAPSPGKARAPKPPQPTDDMVKVWNETAGAAGAVKCRVVAKSWVVQLLARWESSGKTDDERLAMFHAQCKTVAESKLCTGKKTGKDGADPWRASLEWLSKEANWAKVANGNYDRDNAAPPAPEPPPPPPPLPELTAPSVDWSRVLEVLAARVNGQCEQWICPLVYAGDRGSCVELVAGDEFSAGWVRDNLSESIRDALQVVMGRALHVRVVAGGGR